MADFLTPIRTSASPLKLTPSNSPASRSPVRSPTRVAHPQASLSLRKVIGTTSANPTGLASHGASGSLAFCAGSAVVLAELDEQCNISQRFYKAKPTALAVNPTVSFYNGSQGMSTPERRRKSFAPTRTGLESYSPTSSPSRDWLENGGSKTWTSRERIKSATAVSLSPDGRFLAIGETGYSPRVLIFSTAADAPKDIPISILSEHSFGIRAIAFSPDSQHLATLGDTNDGFLLVWTINSRTGAARLLSANKCTAYINDMVWMGRNIVTVGTRHVKVWRVLENPAEPPSPSKSSRLTIGGESPASPTPRALLGRNCLLGGLVDSKFTCITPISDNEAVACTNRGDICLIDDTEKQQRLYVAKKVDFKVNCITKDSRGPFLWIGGRDGVLKRESIAVLRDLARSNQTFATARQASVPYVASPGTPPTPRKTSFSPKSDLLALASILGKLVVLDADHSVSIANNSLEEEEPSLTTSLPAHKDAVQGLEIIRTAGQKQGFVTWSRDGSVKCWDAAGRLQRSFGVQLEQLECDDDLEVRNELKVVRATEDGSHFITGDKYGVIRVFKPDEPSNVREARAHGAELTSIATYRGEDTFFLATSGRDRMVQLFSYSKDSLNLIQTIDDHVGAVNIILFTEEGQRLLSGSSDRTVIVHERITRSTGGSHTIAFVPLRVITLKASPTSMTLVPGDQDSLIVSTMNHQIIRIDMSTGHHVDSFKTSDPDNNDLIVIHSLKAQRQRRNGQPRIVVGVSSTDKSVRVYDLDKGQLLTREFGHCEGVSDVAFLDQDDMSEENSKLKIVTTGLDGTIMIWNFATTDPQSLQDIGQARLRTAADAAQKESVAMKPPLRRVLSRSELAEYMVLDPSTGDTTSSPSTRPRDSSPPRVRRKSSKPNLHAGTTNSTASPSAPVLPDIPESTLKKHQISPTATWTSNRNRSPSPPPRSPNLANRPRLRRPPSVPSNLRSIGRAGGKGVDIKGDASSDSPTFTSFTRPPPPPMPQTLSSVGKQLCEMLQNFRTELKKNEDKKLGTEEADAKVVRDVARELGETMAVLERTSAVAGQVGTGKGVETEGGGDVDTPSASKTPATEGAEGNGNGNDVAMMVLDNGVKGLNL